MSAAYPFSPPHVSNPRSSLVTASPDAALGMLSYVNSIASSINPSSPAPLQNSLPGAEHSKFSTPDRAPDPQQISSVFTPSCYPREELQASAAKSLSPFTPFCKNSLTPLERNGERNVEQYYLSASKRILFTPPRSVIKCGNQTNNRYQCGEENNEFYEDGSIVPVSQMQFEERLQMEVALGANAAHGMVMHPHRDCSFKFNSRCLYTLIKVGPLLNYDFADCQKTEKVVDESPYLENLPPRESPMVVSKAFTKPPQARPPANLTQTKPICCNCKKSQCLKLYCECFANGRFCHGCNCVNCLNIEENKAERDKAMKATLERNPTAFDPKIAKEHSSEVSASLLKHTRGCHCKKSGCQKKYCECFQSGVRCTDLCKCEGCKNMDPEEGAAKVTQPTIIEEIQRTPLREMKQKAVLNTEERRTPLIGGKRRKADKDKSGEKAVGPRRIMERVRQISKKGLAMIQQASGKKERLKNALLTRSSKKAITNN